MMRIKNMVCATQAATIIPKPLITLTNLRQEDTIEKFLRFGGRCENSSAL